MNQNSPLPEQPVNPIQLHEELTQLQRQQLTRPKWNADPTKSDEENARAKELYEAEEAALICKQIDILMVLRRTGTTGPAKAGGKRAKAQPKDINAIAARILGVPTV